MQGWGRIAAGWAVGAGAAMMAPAAGAQMWFDVAGIMRPVVLNPCPDGRCPGVQDDDDAADGDAGGGRQQLTMDAADTPVAAGTNLAYAPLEERRRANLAAFVSKMRDQDPAGAAAMEQLFTATDVFALMSAALAPYGYSVDNVGDAYAFWWMTAWEGAQGSNRDFSQAEMRAVQAQAHGSLAAAPEMARATDAQKQEMAEALWIQAAMIDGMVDMAAQQPELMPQVQSAIREGARASGLDLDAMRLTEAGFVPG